MNDAVRLWKLGSRAGNQIQHVRLSGAEGERHFEGLRILPGHRAEDFLFQQDSVRIGGYLFRRMSITPSEVNRPDTPDSRSELRFTFLLTGKMALTQAGRTVVLGPGDSAVTIGWQPYISQIIEPSVLIRVNIDRETLDDRGIVFPHTVRKLPAPSLLASGLAGFFMGLFEPRLYPLSLDQATRLSRVFDAFFVELHLGYVEEGKAPEDRVVEQREAILDYVRVRSGLQPVSVAGVAEHYNMSTRSLQRLFQDAPRSLREELRLIQEARA